MSGVHGTTLLSLSTSLSPFATGGTRAASEDPPGLLPVSRSPSVSLAGVFDDNCSV